MLNCCLSAAFPLYLGIVQIGQQSDEKNEDGHSCPKNQSTPLLSVHGVVNQTGVIHAEKLHSSAVRPRKRAAFDDFAAQHAMTHVTQSKDVERKSHQQFGLAKRGFLVA
jgi:hypothetical protein